MGTPKSAARQKPVGGGLRQALRGGVSDGVFEAGEAQLRAILPVVGLICAAAGAVGAGAQHLVNPTAFRPWALVGYTVLAITSVRWLAAPPAHPHLAATLVGAFLATMIGHFAWASGETSALLHLGIHSAGVFYLFVGRGALILLQLYMFGWLAIASSSLVGHPQLGSHLTIAFITWCGGLALHIGRTGVLASQIRMRQALEEESLERRRVQELLLDARKRESLGLMAGGVAHDFNNLLVGVVGGVDLLTSAQTEEDRAFAIETIRQSSVSAQELSRQMLDLAGGRPISRNAVPIDAIVREAASRARVTLNENVEIELAIPDALPPVQGDRTQLLQAVTNLLGNAIEATEPAGGIVRLQLEVDTGNETMLLDVHDHGPGIPAEIRDRIFDPFFTTKFTGRGIGLATVAIIVERHGGSVQLLDTANGAHFRVRLPLAREVVDSGPLPDNGSRAWTGAGLVLLVDDDDTVRKTGRKLLEEIGFEVCEAHGGHEALRMFKAQPAAFRAAIVDATMPDLDGARTVDALRGIEPTLPILVSSGYDARSVGGENNDQRRLPFLAKPYGREQLRRALQGLLSRDGDGPNAVGRESRPSSQRTD